MRIHFEYGRTWSFDELPDNSIALDGAVQAPQIDNDRRRYSFDHHAGVSRFVALATCQQVALALEMGLTVDDDTVVYVNDLDSDTMVSLWLLLHPERWSHSVVKELVLLVGRMDAHYLGPQHPMHPLLTPWKEVQDDALLQKLIGLLDQWWAGTIVYPKGRPPMAGKAFGWSPLLPGGWVDFGDTADGFGPLYAEGYTAGVVYSPAVGGGWTYTVGKRSDFVQVPVGPSHRDRDADPASYRDDTLLGALGLLERELNSAQDHKTNWGGGSTIGGGPRNPGQVGSCIEPQRVLQLLRELSP